VNQREASRKEWTSKDNFDGINSGSLQRIADACEKMAASYDQMRESRDRYEQMYERMRDSVDNRDRTIAALRGVITRMKRKVEK
jgi:uncharacterized protein Yka (UPF0111/DUF47 family)